MNVEIKAHDKNTYTAVVNGLTYGPFYTTKDPKAQAIRLYEIDMEVEAQAQVVGGTQWSRMMMTTGGDL